LCIVAVVCIIALACSLCVCIFAGDIIVAAALLQLFALLRSLLLALFRALLLALLPVFTL
jgi:hypothetical protein